MIKKRSVRASRLQRVAETSGPLSETSNLFDSLAVPIKRVLLERVSLATGELPLFASFCSAGRWSLITTDRICWEESQELRSLSWDQVLDVGPTERDWQDTASGKISKRELEILVLTTAEGPFQVYFQRGAPFLVAWQAISLFTRPGRLEAEAKASER